MKKSMKKRNDKTVSKKQVTDMIKSQTQNLKKIVYTSATAFSGSGANNLPIDMPTVGTGYNNAAGNNWILESLDFELYFQQGKGEETAAVSIYPTPFRVMVVQVIAPSYANVPWTVTDVLNEFGDLTFKNQKTVQSPLSYGQPDLCHVLLDYRDAIIPFTPKAAYTRKFKLKPRIKRINYNATLTEYETGNIFVITWLGYDSSGSGDWGAGTASPIGSYSAGLCFRDV